MNPFIRNEQYNQIEAQVRLVQASRTKSLPAAVLRAVVELAQANILFAFSDATPEQQHALQFSAKSTNEEIEVFLQQIKLWMLPFPDVSAEQVKKLFPKQKKLRLPDSEPVDVHRLTYMSWHDKRSQQKIIICQQDEQLVGITCTPSPNIKKNTCAFCDAFTDVTYCTTVTKAKQAKNPDYYKAIGTYICVDPRACNETITNQEALQTFVRTALPA